MALEDSLPPKPNTHPRWKYKVKRLDSLSRSPITPPTAYPTTIKSAGISKDEAGLSPCLSPSSGTPPRVLPLPTSHGAHPPDPDSMGQPNAGKSSLNQWGTIHQANSVISNKAAPVPRRRLTLTRANCLLAVLCFVVALALVVLVYRLASARSKRTDPDMCFSTACLHHASLIASHINHSAEPCEDFEAFACSRWAAAAAAYNYGPALMRLQIAAWFREFKVTE